MSCTNAPSLSVVGTVDYCTPTGSCPLPLSLTLGEVTAFEKLSPTVVGGGTLAIAPGTPPANFLWITTVQPIRIVLNGGSEFIPVERMLILTGDFSSLVLHNDVVGTAKDVQVDVTFATGIYL